MTLLLIAYLLDLDIAISRLQIRCRIGIDVQSHL